MEHFLHVGGQLGEEEERAEVGRAVGDDDGVERPCGEQVLYCGEKRIFLNRHVVVCATHDIVALHFANETVFGRRLSGQHLSF